MSDLTRFLLAAVLVALSACTAEEVYDNTDDLRLRDCEKRLQQDERLNCEERARTSYDDFRKKLPQREDNP